MKIHLVFITYNRLEYTKLSIASVLADPDEKFSLTIWDNGSTDGTAEYLKNEVSDERITDIVLSKENIGQTAAINEIWSKSKADLLGKLDNDCVMTPGWTKTLAQAHKDIDNLGVVACWHLFPDEFDYEKAKSKIQTLGKHQILRHPWTCGTGLLIKRKMFEKFGPIQSRGTTQYWLKMALAGCINGFYYPLIYQKHLDDTRSKHSRINIMPFEKACEYMPAHQAGMVKSLRQYNRFHREIVENILTGPYEPKYYTGFQARVRQMLNRAKNIIYT